MTVIFLVKLIVVVINSRRFFLLLLLFFYYYYFYKAKLYYFQVGYLFHLYIDDNDYYYLILHIPVPVRFHRD